MPQVWGPQGRWARSAARRASAPACTWAVSLAAGGPEGVGKQVVGEWQPRGQAICCTRDAQGRAGCSRLAHGSPAAPRGCYTLQHSASLQLQCEREQLWRASPPEPQPAPRRCPCAPPSRLRRLLGGLQAQPGERSGRRMPKRAEPPTPAEMARICTGPDPDRCVARLWAGWAGCKRAAAPPGAARPATFAARSLAGLPARPPAPSPSLRRVVDAGSTARTQVRAQRGLPGSGPPLGRPARLPARLRALSSQAPPIRAARRPPLALVLTAPVPPAGPALAQAATAASRSCGA